MDEKTRSQIRDELKRLERAYRILVRSKLKLSDAVVRLREELCGGDDNGDDDNIAALLAFIEASERGVITDVPGRKGGRGGG